MNIVIALPSKPPRLNMRTLYFHLLFTDTVCPNGWMLYDEVCIKIINNYQLYYDKAQAYGCSEGQFYGKPDFGYWVNVSTKNIIGQGSHRFYLRTLNKISRQN